MTKTYHHEKEYRRKLAEQTNTAFICLGIPPKPFRKMLNKLRRSRAKQALREGKEPLPEKKDANWHWW